MQVFLEGSRAHPITRGGSPQFSSCSCKEYNQPIKRLMEDAVQDLAQMGEIADYQPPVQLVQISQRDLQTRQTQVLTIEEGKLLLKEANHYDTRSFYLWITLPHPLAHTVLMSADRRYVLKADPTSLSITAEPVLCAASLDLRNSLYHFKLEGPRNNRVVVPAVNQGESGSYSLGVAQDGRVVMEDWKNPPAAFTVKTAAAMTWPN